MSCYYNIHAHAPASDPACIRALVSLSPNQFLNAKTHWEGVPVALGIHPWEMNEERHWMQELQRIERLLDSPQVVAVGECGLDATITTPLPEQEALFRAQIQLAEQFRKPMILHAVHSLHALLRLRKELNPCQPWIVHGFRGNGITANQLRQAGIWVAVGRHFHASLFNVFDWHHVLIESDTESADVTPEIVGLVAERCGATCAEVASASKMNALRLIPTLDSF